MLLGSRTGNLGTIKEHPRKDLYVVIKERDLKSTFHSRYVKDGFGVILSIMVFLPKSSIQLLNKRVLLKTK